MKHVKMKRVRRDYKVKEIVHVDLGTDDGVEFDDDPHIAWIAFQKTVGGPISKSTDWKKANGDDPDGGFLLRFDGKHGPRLKSIEFIPQKPGIYTVVLVSLTKATEDGHATPHPPQHATYRGEPIRVV